MQKEMTKTRISACLVVSHLKSTQLKKSGKIYGRPILKRKERFYAAQIVRRNI